MVYGFMRVDVCAGWCGFRRVVESSSGPVIRANRRRKRRGSTGMYRASRRSVAHVDQGTRGTNHYAVSRSQSEINERRDSRRHEPLSKRQAMSHADRARCDFARVKSLGDCDVSCPSSNVAWPELRGLNGPGATGRRRADRRRIHRRNAQRLLKPPSPAKVFAAPSIREVAWLGELNLALQLRAAPGLANRLSQRESSATLRGLSAKSTADQDLRSAEKK